MGHKPEGPADGPEPSPVACPGFPRGRSVGTTRAPHGLAQRDTELGRYLQQQVDSMNRLHAENARRTQDKRCSPHTRRQYTSAASTALSMSQKYRRMLEEYDSLVAAATNTTNR